MAHENTPGLPARLPEGDVDGGTKSRRGARTSTRDTEPTTHGGFGQCWRRAAALAGQLRPGVLTGEQLSSNKTLPVTLSSIQIHGAANTRRSFLSPLFQPLVQASQNEDLTLDQVLERVGLAVEKLQKFGEARLECVGVWRDASACC